MAVFDADEGKIVVRIVYDGPALAGKTTNLQQLCNYFTVFRRSELFSPATVNGRTTFFDWLQVDSGLVAGHPLRSHFLTVPGQSVLARRRFHLLTLADVIVFVADSSPGGLKESAHMFHVLEMFRESSGLTAPLVIQANKQDVQGAAGAEGIKRKLGAETHVPVVGAHAANGGGVRETAVLAIRAAADLVQARILANGLESLTGTAQDGAQLRSEMLESEKQDTRTPVQVILDHRPRSQARTAEALEELEPEPGDVEGLPDAEVLEPPPAQPEDAPPPLVSAQPEEAPSSLVAKQSDDAVPPEITHGSAPPESATPRESAVPPESAAPRESAAPSAVDIAVARDSDAAPAEELEDAGPETARLSWEIAPEESTAAVTKDASAQETGSADAASETDRHSSIPSHVRASTPPPEADHVATAATNAEHPEPNREEAQTGTETAAPIAESASAPAMERISPSAIVSVTENGSERISATPAAASTNGAVETNHQRPMSRPPLRTVSSAPTSGERSDMMPALPKSDVASGFVWPSSTGREVLRRIPLDIAVLRPDLRGSFGTADGSGRSDVFIYEAGIWCLKTSRRRCFHDPDEARGSLLTLARKKIQLGDLLENHTVLSLQQDKDRYWLWTVAPWVGTLRATMNHAVSSKTEENLAATLETFAETAARCAALAARNGLVLDVHPSNFAKVGTKVVYIDDDINIGGTAPLLGPALLRRFDEYSEWPMALERYSSALQRELTTQLDALEISELDLADSIRGASVRTDVANQAKHDVLAALGRALRSAS